MRHKVKINSINTKKLLLLTNCVYDSRYIKLYHQDLLILYYRNIKILDAIKIGEIFIFLKKCLLCTDIIFFNKIKKKISLRIIIDVKNRYMFIQNDIDCLYGKFYSFVSFFTLINLNKLYNTQCNNDIVGSNFSTLKIFCNYISFKSRIIEVKLRCNGNVKKYTMIFYCYGSKQDLIYYDILVLIINFNDNNIKKLQIYKMDKNKLTIVIFESIKVIKNLFCLILNIKRVIKQKVNIKNFIFSESCNFYYKKKIIIFLLKAWLVYTQNINTKYLYLLTKLYHGTNIEKNFIILQLPNNRPIFVCFNRSVYNCMKSMVNTIESIFYFGLSCIQIKFIL